MFEHMNWFGEVNGILGAGMRSKEEEEEEGWNISKACYRTCATTL